MVLMVISGARGTLIYEKNLKSKFSCQTPFNTWAGKNYFQMSSFTVSIIHYFCCHWIRFKSTQIRMAPDPHKTVLAGMFLHLFIDYLLKILCLYVW
jgi:hypothetical protein